ncbi:MAG: glutamate--tRNA ligase family protein, partial [Gemmatimonadota bacterium]
IVENSGLATRPRQYEFARGNLDYMVMSKRKLLTLVREGHVGGWDDPRMPTIAGLRRRGVTPESIRAFWDMLGIAKTHSRVDIGKLEYAIRDDLNTRAPRRLCVLRPLRVVLTSYPEGEGETLDASSWPHDVPREGSRPVPLSRELFIEADDFVEEPPAGWRRLAPGRAVRLRHGYVIRCDQVIHDDNGAIRELRCTHAPDSLEGAAPEDWEVGGAIHWVDAARSVPCQVRLYDRLFRVPDPDAEADARGREFTDFLNPDSLVVVDGARVEPVVAHDPAGSRYQFERLGYFMSDEEESSGDRLVFNRIVTLRDTWARKAKGEEPAGPGAGPAGDRAGAAGERGPELSPEEHRKLREAAAPSRSRALQERRRRFEAELGVEPGDAELLTREEALADFFEAAVEAGASAQRVANWTVNELPREIGERTLENLPFGGAEFGALVALLEDGTLSSSTAREVLAEMVATGDAPDTVVDRKGLRQISDEAALGDVVDRVIAAHPSKADEYRAGRDALLGFFMGQVMRETGGKANPGLAKQLIRERLAG